MGVEISVKLKCSVCKRTIPVKGSIIRGRRRDSVRVEDVLTIIYPIKPESHFDLNIDVTKGAETDELGENRGPEEGFKVTCGPVCAMKALQEVVPKLWKMKAKSEDEE